MASGQQEDMDELEARARQGETVIPGGKSLEAQERLAEGRSKGGETRKEQLGTEGYKEMGHRGGEMRKEQIGKEGYQKMGRKGGLSTKDKSGGEREFKKKGSRSTSPSSRQGIARCSKRRSVECEYSTVVD